MSSARLKLLNVVAITVMAAVNGVAMAADAAPPSTQADWPSKVVVTVGDITTRVDGPKLWTLSGIDFKKTMMATEDSAYGTVFTIRGVGHLGTAHFLDVPGKPGEIEKENVKSLAMFLDGKPVAFKPEMELSGGSFRMERVSAIRTTDLKSTVTLADGVLSESVKLHANEMVDLQTVFPLMYAWTPHAMACMIGDENGVVHRGPFTPKERVDKTFPNATWAAVFDPKAGKGSVFYLAEKPKDVATRLMLVDAPPSYRKIAAMTFVEEKMSKGFEGTFTSRIGFFEAGEADWEAVAEARLKAIKAAAPKP